MEQDTLNTLEFDLTEAIKDLIFHIRQNNSEIESLKKLVAERGSDDV